MGTNFYMTVDSCGSCGRGTEQLHIGKSSFGWTFSLNTHPDHGLNTLDDWKSAWSNNPIKDEYGDNIAASEMERIILDRQSRTTGPLSRHSIDGRFCIAHGDGPYDIMRGEFL